MPAFATLKEPPPLVSSIASSSANVPSDANIAATTTHRRRFLSTGDITGPKVAERMDSAQVTGDSTGETSMAVNAADGSSESFAIISEDVEQDPNAQNGNKASKKNYFRGLLRRASVSIKNATTRTTRGRRFSTSAATVLAPSNESKRPSTSVTTTDNTFYTTKGHLTLKYHPGSKNAMGEEITAMPATEYKYYEDYQPLTEPGEMAPYKSYRAGSAARAAAAAHNEMLMQQRLSAIDSGADAESAVSLSFFPSARSSTLQQRVDRFDFTQILPYEISSLIFSFLSHEQLVVCELVCKKWKHIVDSPAVWRAAFLRERVQAVSLGRQISGGAGIGVPEVKVGADWKKLYKASWTVSRNWKEGEAESRMLLGHTDSVYCVQFDEHKIITGSRDRTVRIWDMHTGHCSLIICSPLTSRTLPPPRTRKGITTRHLIYPQYHDASILCLQYDASILVTGSSDNTAIVHDIHNAYTPLFHLRHHSSAVLDVCFNEDYIVTASKDCTIAYWSRATGELLGSVNAHTAPVNSVQMNGNLVVSASGDFSVKLWSLPDPSAKDAAVKLIRDFSGHTKGLACSAFTADGRYILSAGNDKEIRVWSAITGECVRVIPAHDALIRSLSVDDVSGRIISGSYDQSVCVWDLEKGNMLAEYPAWHRSWVLAAKGDWRRLVSAAQDGSLCVLDFGKGVEGVEELSGGGGKGVGEDEGRGKKVRGGWRNLLKGA